MISNLQVFSKNIFFKIIVLLIIVSFVFWGIADIFRNFSDHSIARIGKYKILSEDVTNTAKKDAEELQRIFGNNIPLGQLKLFNLEQSALQKLINRYLLASFNDDMGISVGVNTILAKIQS